jgi:hypothetical protein
MREIETWVELATGGRWSVSLVVSHSSRADGAQCLGSAPASRRIPGSSGQEDQRLRRRKPTLLRALA